MTDSVGITEFVNHRKLNALCLLRIRKLCKERFHGINAEHEIRTEKCLEHDDI